MSKATLTDPQHFARSLLRPSEVPPQPCDTASEWLAERGRASSMTVERVPLDELSTWTVDPASGALQHASGRFFRVEGLSVEVTQGAIRRWQQPIIHQPEVGILGILAKQFGGVLHFLMQAKVEPGNPNGIQLAPTVQATVSNYTGVHAGKSVPYLDHFRDRRQSASRRIADVRQSEQGSWFYRKRNRNMVVETFEDVPVLDGFRWFTLGEIHDLLPVEDTIGMSARSVLACFPMATRHRPDSYRAGSDFSEALIDSCIAEPRGEVSNLRQVLQWITDVRTRHDCRTATTALDRLEEWDRSAGSIRHVTGDHFEVIGVRARANDREVSQWDQPMLAPTGTGTAAFVVKAIDETLHVLVRAKVEPGLCDVAEIAPTVQCAPQLYRRHAGSGLERDLLRFVETAPDDQVRFTARLSEEGGRLYHATSTYSVVESPTDFDLDHPDYRWLSVAELSELLVHSHYVNVQARTLLTCLAALLPR